MMMLKKPKILVVGSFMMDLIASANRVPQMGETVIGTDFRTAPGGKGANQAVQCARLGADVCLAGCVGTDAFGTELLETAAGAGVDVSHVKRSEAHASGVGNIQLEVTQDGVQNRILVVPGANYDLMPEDLAWMETEISHYDMLMLQLELTAQTTTFAAACAHRAGVPVMLNPAPAAPMSRELLSCVTYLSPNEHEAALLSGCPLRADKNGVNEADLEKISAVLRATGVEKLMITLGSNGSVICTDSGIVHTACVKMPAVKDPTAAGDSFVAAFCTGVSAGMGERQALEFASHTAAITVCGMGAMPSLPELTAVQSLMTERHFSGFDPKLLDVLR